ncbi:TlpA family protein disulfide reductase [Arsenicibacter rosenii]|nr:TlpA disulfide reductase family protein [Arsenicibacter rosenii]
MKKMISLLSACLVHVTLFAQPKTGDSAPEIHLEGIYNKPDGTIPTLQALKGKVVILDFWATWCGPCIASFPKNNKIYNENKDKGVVLLAISDDSKTKLENFLGKVKFDFWFGMDSDKSDLKSYGIEFWPTVFIIDRNGNVAYRGNELSQQILDKVLANQGTALGEQPEKGQGKTAVTVRYGSFNGGIDPLVTGFQAGQGKTSRMVFDKKNNVTFSPYQFTIRQSLVSSLFGWGTDERDGFVGFTVVGATLSEAFFALKELKSTAWIKNNTSDTTRYDVIYRKRSAGYPKMIADIQQGLAENLLVRLDSTTAVQEVKVLMAKTGNEKIKPMKEIKGSGLDQLYVSVKNLIYFLETTTGSIYEADESLKDMYIHKGLTTIYEMSGNELTDWLKTVDIQVKPVRKSLTTYQVNSIN